MKKQDLIVLLAACFIAATAIQANAEPRVTKPVDLDRQSFLNNVTDNIATIGKPDWKKKQIKQQRHVQRKKARLNKALERNRHRQQ